MSIQKLMRDLFGLGSFTIEMTEHGEVTRIESHSSREQFQYHFIEPGNRGGGKIYGQILVVTIDAMNEENAIEKVNNLRLELQATGEWQRQDRRAINVWGRRSGEHRQLAIMPWQRKERCVMKVIFGFILGVILTLAGQLLAQTGFQSDNQGNMSLFYYNPPQYPQPMPQQDWNGPSRNMQQNLNEIIRQGNPC